MLKWARKVILFKTEVTYGVDPVPTGAANAILASDVTFDPNPQTPLARNLVKPTLGPVHEPIAGRHSTISFSVEAAGAGAAGTVPKYGPLLRAAGLSETVNAGVSVVYAPVSTAEDSAAAYFNLDGTLHKMLGCRGNVEFAMAANQIPMLKFSFTGLHVDPSAVALPTADFSGFKDPVPANRANTPTFSLHAFAAVLQSLSLNLNQRVAYRNLVNSESVDITGRKPAGSCTIEEPPIGTKDFYAIAKAETLAALQLIHGVGGGNIVQIDATKVQLINPRKVEIDGAAGLQMDLNPTETAGNDELTITVK